MTALLSRAAQKHGPQPPSPEQHAPPPLVVEARGARGEPRGGLAVVFELGWPLRLVEEPSSWRELTDPLHGRVEFPGAGAWFRAAADWNARVKELPIERGPWGLGFPPTASVWIDALPAGAAERLTIVPGAPRSSVVLDASRVTALELELIVAPSVATFVDAALVEQSTGKLFALTADRESSPTRLRTRLEHVVLGQRLDFTVQRNGASDPLRALVRPDDVSPNDVRPDGVRYEHRAAVGLGAGVRSLQVTVSSGGEPVRSEALELAVFESALRKTNVEERRARVSTDAEGSLIVDVAEKPWLERRLVLVQRGERPQDDRVGALDLTGGEATVELERRGAISLEVVDPLGAPVEWSRLDPTSTATWYESDRWLGPTGTQTPGFDENGRARVVRSDASYACGRGWRGAIYLSAPGYVPVFTGSDEGDAVLRLVLEPLGSVAGYLRANRRSGHEDFNLLLLRREENVPEALSPGVSLGCACDGRFLFSGQRAGVFTLVVRRVRAGQLPQELTRVERIELSPGQALDLGDVSID